MESSGGPSPFPKADEDLTDGCDIQGACYENKHVRASGRWGLWAQLRSNKPGSYRTTQPPRHLEFQTILPFPSPRQRRSEAALG